MLHKIKLQDELTQDFCQLPLFLFKNDTYKNMKLESKVIYSFMKDRISLSIKNRWVNDENDIYIIMPNYEIMELMGCSEPKVISCKKELNDYGLIQEIRQGFNKPNLIFVLVDKDITYYKKSIKKNAVDEDNIKESNEVENNQENSTSNVERINTDEIISYNEFFEKVWKNILNDYRTKGSRIKEGKGQVKPTQRKKLMKVGEKVLNKCLDLYLLEHTDKKYHLKGSTWLNSGYEDYVKKAIDNLNCNNEDEEKEDTKSVFEMISEQMENK